jgi:hypothetical protein
VAYTVLDGTLITGFQGNAFDAIEDVYREDWNIYFDTRKKRISFPAIAPSCPTTLHGRGCARNNRVICPSLTTSYALMPYDVTSAIATSGGKADNDS